MQLRSIKEGDIVRLNKRGREFLAFVTRVGDGEIGIDPLGRDTYTQATPREVISHWALRGRRRRTHTEEGGQ